MDWPEPEEKSLPGEDIIQKGISGEGIALIVVASFLLIGMISLGILMRMRKVECVIPKDEPTSPRTLEMAKKPLPKAKLEAMKFAMRKPLSKSPRKIDPPPVKEEEDDEVNITPKMLAAGSRRQMRMKRKEKIQRHMRVQELKNDMLPSGGHDMHLEHVAHKKTNDEGWERTIKSHRTINRHPARDTKRYGGNPTLAQKTKN